MTKRIDALTDEQAARLPAYRAEMLAQGLATGPCDRAKVEDAVRTVYRCAGFEPPEYIVWMSSPLGGVIATGILGDQLRGQLRDQLGDQLRDQLGEQLGGQLRDQLREQLGDQLGRAVYGQLWDQLREQLGGQLRDQLRDQLGGQLRGQLRDQLRDQLGEQLGDQLGRAVYGQHDLYWLAWLRFALDIGVRCEQNQSEWLDALIEVGNSGWWWPFKGGVVLTDRPNVLNRDAQGRLHCDNGWAILYEDGWGIWEIHGIRVTEQIVMRPDTITVEDVMKEGNAEVRRVMCERMGWDRFVTESKLQLVHECQDPANAPHTLRLYDSPEQFFDVPVRLLLMVNGTPKPNGEVPRYGVTVPQEIDAADEAAAWLADVPVEQYRLLQRRT
jgi:hypothetical protein